VAAAVAGSLHDFAMRIAHRSDGRLSILIRSDDALRAAMAALVSLVWIVPFRMTFGYAGLPDYYAYYQIFDAMAADGTFPPLQLDYLSNVHFWIQLQLASGVERALQNTYNTNSFLIMVATVFLAVRNKVRLPYLILFAGVFTTQMHVSLLRATPAYFLVFFALDQFIRTGKINLALMLLAISFHSSAAIALAALVAARTRMLHSTALLAMLLAMIGAVMLSGIGQRFTAFAITVVSASVPGFSKYLIYILEPNSTSMFDLMFRSLILLIGAWIAIVRRDYPTHFRVFLIVIVLAFLGLSFSPNIANRAIVYGVGFAVLIYNAKTPLGSFATSVGALSLGIASFVFRWYWFAENQAPW